MKREDVVDILNVIRKLDDKEYMFSMLSFNIAPTILKNKPSSLLTLSKNNKNLYDLWNKYGDEFSNRLLINSYCLKDTGNTLSVLFYRVNQLKSHIFKNENIEFLEGFGYSKDMNIYECLNLLKLRYEKSCPTELGIFLGIPQEDIKGFMNCPKENFILCGYWKVYHNVEKAYKIFKSYDEARYEVLNTVKSQISKKDFTKNIYLQ